MCHFLWVCFFIFEILISSEFFNVYSLLIILHILFDCYFWFFLGVFILFLHTYLCPVSTHIICMYVYMFHVSYYHGFIHFPAARFLVWIRRRRRNGFVFLVYLIFDYTSPLYIWQLYICTCGFFLQESLGVFFSKIHILDFSRIIKKSSPTVNFVAFYSIWSPEEGANFLPYKCFLNVFEIKSLLWVPRS